MEVKMFLALFLFTSLLQSSNEKNSVEKDIIKTSSGDIAISFIGHGSLMFEYKGKIIHVDPWGKLADYLKLPKADIILVTHHHFDHLDEKAITAITKKGTQIVLTHEVFNVLKKGIVMRNGDTRTVEGISIDAVPAYNTTKGHEQFHPKGRDNGYLIVLGGKKIYIAGDTEDIPEMASLKNIDVAFLPMNQPYTMLPEQVAYAVHTFHPKILYPYHYGETDVSKIQTLLSKDSSIEVRIRSMK
jgi:L-ascorbate metabolism protein UlaG (beta-lactamase superfamily)